jgi:hypothetical protein
MKQGPLAPFHGVWNNSFTSGRHWPENIRFLDSAPAAKSFGSVVQDGDLEGAQPLGVCHDFHLRDPPARDGHDAHAESRAHGATTTPTAPLTSAGRANRARSANASALRHGRCATDLPGYALRGGGAVDPEHHVRVEHREERVEVATARGSEKGAISEMRTPARGDADVRFTVMAMRLLPTLAFSGPHRDPHRAGRGRIPLDGGASIGRPVSSGWITRDLPLAQG